MFAKAEASLPDSIVSVYIVFPLLHQFQAMSEGFLRGEAIFGKAHDDLDQLGRELDLQSLDYATERQCNLALHFVPLLWWNIES